MSVPVRSTLRSTLLWAVVPAAILYAVALVWSGAEGISAKLVLQDLAQSCKAPLGEGFLYSVRSVSYTHLTLPTKRIV